MSHISYKKIMLYSQLQHVSFLQSTIIIIQLLLISYKKATISVEIIVYHSVMVINKWCYFLLLQI